MNFAIETTTRIEDPANLIASSILNQLKLGKKVLFFATGGSSIAVASRVAEIIKDESLPNLTVMMTDERYGEVGHNDSNWAQLIKKGFALSEAKLLPILDGNDIDTTTEEFKINLERELKNAEYKIASFGVGADGHTAGILPGTIAVHSTDLACHYDTPAFFRITITPMVIERLDQAVVWMQGENKWPVVENLSQEIDIEKQPVQILKKIPLLTIFTDYKKNFS
jgi:6-phosphogluconolactonase/glucosamine-6-phosphate isomerase/deaminase